MWVFEILASFLGAVMPPVLILAGVYFAVRLRGFFILHPVGTARLMSRRRGDGISPVRAASMALAGTLGVGNITGVVSAIAAGGAGAVFWMWVSAFAAMSVKYAETALAVTYRRRSGDGYYGGAPYYIADGMKTRRARGLGAVFAVLCIGNAFTVGGVLQVNAAARSTSELLGVSPYAVGGVLAILTLCAVTGGAERITNVTVWMIPAVSAVYIFMCISVIVICRDALPDAAAAIFRDAFSLRAAGGGAGGYMITQAIRYGVTRGVITNEAGAGTSPTAHACADAVSPESQGCLGIFEVFADTILICTLTALAVLTAGISMTGDAMADATQVFESVLGDGSGAALSLCVFVFVLATLFSQHYYARVALRFLGLDLRGSIIFTAAFMCMIILGSGMAPPVVWLSADITVGAMTLINVFCLWKMRRMVNAPEMDAAKKSVAGNDAGRTECAPSRG